MILLVNKLGTTNVSLSQLKLEENSRRNSSIDAHGGILKLDSARVFLSLEHTCIYKTFVTFLHLTGLSAEINISNTHVDGFYSATPGGGVVDLFQSNYCFLLIKDSSFQNGNNIGSGGVVSIVAPNSTLTIQNCTIHNISSSNSGGVVYVESRQNAQSQSSNLAKNFLVLLHIINSSFHTAHRGVTVV